MPLEQRPFERIYKIWILLNNSRRTFEMLEALNIVTEVALQLVRDVV